MIKRMFLFFLMSFSFFTYTQEVKEYVSFNGSSYESYFFETDYTVVYIEKSEINSSQLNDTITLSKILNRIDSIYEFYKTNLGYEPSGGVAEFGNKSPVFFGPPSCGSGCGLIGSKGIEVSGFNEIFFHIKNELNVTRDIIIAYEFGRNFSNENLKKIISPNTEKNGGFYEEFASYMAYKFYDEFLEGSERELNETLLNKIWFKQKFLGYINDLDANPENSLFSWEKIQMQDMNRGVFVNNDSDPSYS